MTNDDPATPDPSGDDLDPAEFEEMVEALLKVDPEGITGQRSAKAKKATESDES